jgi:hypothetical protein
MIWVKLPTGDKWHPIGPEGKPFCGCPGEYVATVDTQTQTPPAWPDRCQNCDNTMRRRSKSKGKPTRKPRYINPKTNYRPKNKTTWG